MIKVQLEFPEEKMKQLEDLVKECGLKQKRELINNAITLLVWAVREIDSGRIVASVDEKYKIYSEVLLPIFDNLKKKNQENAEDKEK